MIFYDFEVFMFDWLVVLIEPFTNTKTTIVNDVDELKGFYKCHKNDIWIGYNSRGYDSYILKGILCGFNPKEINDWIIVKKRKGWEYSDLFRNIQLYGFDVASSFHSLKQLEGFMGNDIQETGVSFNINRPLTEKEIEKTIYYCTHDVMQTIEVFMERKADFDAHLDLIKTFNLPINYISKTQAQLSAIALGCQRQSHYDEWDITIVDTLKIDKYWHIVEWFKNPNNYNYSNNYKVDVAGIPHVFGWGGLHGAPNEPIHVRGLLLHVDVTSFYPSIMIQYDMLSRNVQDKRVYEQIYNKRVELKRQGKKKEQAPFKIILNATYGICKDKYSLAYDPLMANNVCINGQLLLLDLIEHLEPYCNLIQSNTDGLIIQIEDTDEAFEKVDDICYEWEQRTHMGLGFDVITEIYQKDVNNYIFKFENGDIERKGAYVKELSRLDNDLPIINKALVDYMVNGVSIEETIYNCNELIMFQKIFKITDRYICGWHNDYDLDGKTFRVFASKNIGDTFIGKVKEKNGVEVIEKFANSPEHCFIENRNVNGVNVPKKLDKDWYIELAKERLKQYGVADMEV